MVHKIFRNQVFLLILPVAVLFLPTLVAGRVLYWGVPGLQIVPWRYFAWQQLSAGQLPLWNSLNGMGAPLLANYQLALFYPPSWITFVFAAAGGPGWLAWSLTLLAALHLVWGGYGVMQLLRELGLEQPAQVICGVSFALCAYFTARIGVYNMIWVGTWLPFLLLFTLRLFNPSAKPAGTFLGLTLTAAMMLLGGHAQLTFYGFQFALLWLTARLIQKRSWRGALTGLAQFGGAIVTACLLSAVQLIPTAEYLLQSQRSSAVDFTTAMSYSFWPWRFISLFAPSFFGNPASGNYWGYGAYWEDAGYFGLLPLLFALGGILRLVFRREKDSPSLIDRWFLFLIVLTGFVFAMGRNTPIFPFLYQWAPGFDMFNGPARYLLWSLMALILLAGFEVDRFCRREIFHSKRYRLFAVISLAIFVGALAGYFILAGQVPTIFIATAAAGGLGFMYFLLISFRPLEVDRRAGWELGLVLLVSLDLLIVNWRTFQTVPLDFFEAQKSEIKPAVASNQRLHIQLSDEYDLKFHRFLRFQSYLPIESLDQIRAIPLPNMNLLEPQSQLTTNFDPMVPEVYQLWMEQIERLPQGEQSFWLKWANVGGILRLNVHRPAGFEIETVESAGRFWWYSCARVIQHEEETLDFLAVSAAASHGLPLVIQSDSAAGKCEDPLFLPAVVRQVSETPLEFTLRFSAPQHGWLAIADTDYPGWFAFIDGAETPIYRANVAFRAIEVPAGDHELRLAYRPGSFAAGAVISIVAVLLVLIFWILQRKT